MNILNWVKLFKIRKTEKDYRLEYTFNELRSLVENSIDAIVIMDSSGVTTEFNPAAERIFGYRKDEILHKTMADFLIPEKYRGMHHEGLNTYLKTGKENVLNRRIEIEARRKGGAVFPVEMVISPIRWRTETRFSAIINDISRRKQKENELTCAYDELRAAYKKLEDVRQSVERKVEDRTKELEEAREASKKAEELKTEFLSTAAHELRTPLTSIQGFSEILLTRDQLSDTHRKKYLGYINKQAKGLGQIINDLLDISRIESGRNFVLEKAEVSMNKFLDHLLEAFRQQSHLRSECHQFTLELPGKSPVLSIDAEKMSSVMKNLVSNAVKYSPDGGTIEVAGVVSGAVYQVSISDQGLGMTPEQVERIFEKFYRVDASNTSTEGTGLGMTIAKNIVEAHGGNIWVESELGQGTTVRFFIPMD